MGIDEEYAYGPPFLGGLHTKHVCEACINDDDLADLIRSNAVEDEACSYCDGEESYSIASMVTVAQYIFEKAMDEHDRAEDWSQHVFQFDTYDLIRDYLELDLDKSLFDDLCGVFGDGSWCSRDPWGPTTSDTYRSSWIWFCELIKHERRYFFHTSQRVDDDDDGVWASQTFDPQTFFEYLGRACSQAGLVQYWPRGRKLYRVRYHGERSPFTDVADFGPPPPDRANQANRMNPPGVPMWYAACDEETALQETFHALGEYSLAKFELTRPVLVIDLTLLAKQRRPSIFSDCSTARSAWAFLVHFVKDVSKPIARDDRSHVEYIPTQVVTEYFRTAFLHENLPVHGLAYKSSQRQGGTSVVLFAKSQDIEGIDDEGDGQPFLRLVSTKVVTAKPSWT